MNKFNFNVGDTFGEWEVVDSNPKMLSFSTHYLCKCSCGLTTRYVNASDLFNKKSSKCKRCSLFAGIEDLSGTYVSVIRKNAKKRKINFDVSTEYLNTLFKEQNKMCKLTGLPITLHRNYAQGNRELQTASLDRIDSSKGYEVGNVQWIHKDINIMKNKYSQEYFIETCKNIAKNESNNKQ